jgi:SsrA-binding protein
MKNIAVNKKATHNFTIIKKYEAGIVLTGTEVKSLRINTGSIRESYIVEKNNELWLTNCHIKKYSSSNEVNYNPIKERKILVNKKEKNKLIGSLNREGMSILPLSLYFNNKGIAKLSIGIGKGKKKYDKRGSIKEREWNIKRQRLEKKLKK